MNATTAKGPPSTVHRIDLPCEPTGFTRPPFDVHLAFLPSPANGGGWALLAHTAAGKADALARWLAGHVGIERVRIAPGLAPKLIRATTAALPPAWAAAAAFVKVHHLNLTADGHAAWYVEGGRDQVWELVHHLQARLPNRQGVEAELHVRPVLGEGGAVPISRRQFETLSTAVALGYYEIPHRIDLRRLAAKTGVSLGSVAELLRRAESTILTHYVDLNLMGWPLVGDELRSFQPMVNPLEAAGSGWRPVEGDMFAHRAS